MDFFYIACFFAMLFAPAALITIGIIRRHKDNGILIYMVGVILSMIFIVPFLSPFVQMMISKVLYAFGIIASFHDTTIIDIPLIVLGSWLGYRLFRCLISHKPKQHKTKRHTDAPSSPKADSIYLAESANGMLVRVPHSKLDSWEAAQRGESPRLSEEAKQRLIDRIVADVYGPKPTEESSGDKP